jgi:hypothetical protein
MGQGLAQDFRQIMSDFDRATWEVRSAGQPGGMCRDQRAISDTANACTNFFNVACNSTSDTTSENELISPGIFSAYERAIDGSIRTSPRFAQFQRSIAANNAGGESPLFAEGLEATNQNFQQELCQGKANTNENRQAIIDAMARRFDNVTNPLFSTSAFFGMQNGALDDILVECRARCLRSGGEGRTAAACNTHCRRHEDLVNFNEIMMSMNTSGDIVHSGNAVANTTIVNLFTYMKRSSFPLNAMCRKLTQVLTNVYDSSYNDMLKSSFSGMTPDQKRALSSSVENEMYPAAFKSSTQAILDKVKEESIALMTRHAGGSLPAPLQARLNAIKINWRAGSTLEEIQERSVGKNAAYFQSRNQIDVWGGMRNATPYAMLFTMAHEVGHAMHRSHEIAGMTSDITLTPSVGDLSSCFRKGVAMHPRTRVGQETMGANFNQDGECMGDYYGTEIFFNMINNATPAMSVEQKRLAVAQTVMNCNSSGGLNGEHNDPHPSWRDRSERIIMAHPGMRALFGCSTNTAADPFYCPTGAP